MNRVKIASAIPTQTSTNKTPKHPIPQKKEVSSRITAIQLVSAFPQRNFSFDMGALHSKPKIDANVCISQHELAMAHDITNAFFQAGNNNTSLERNIELILMGEAWTENIAREVLKGLIAGLRVNRAMGPTMRDVSGRARLSANEYVTDSTVFVTMYAIAFLVLLAPDAIKALGFRKWEELKGMLELFCKGLCFLTTLGTFAGVWQASVARYVPRPSLFWFFIVLEMPWGPED
jgi:hypothetical protein